MYTTLRLKLIAAIYLHNANISNSRFTRVESALARVEGQTAGVDFERVTTDTSKAMMLNLGSLTHICIENRGPSRPAIYS
jgi:hypothetical protein